MCFNLRIPDTKLRPKHDENIQAQWAKIRSCERHKSQFMFEYHFLLN